MSKLKYFGTDGIRGTAGQPPMEAGFVYRLGWAAAQVLCGAQNCRPRFLIGRDTRPSGPELRDALTSGLLDAGADVADLGVLPTPAIAYLISHTGASAGAVISASHNPAAENGIKFLNHLGMKLAEEQEAAIEQLLEQQDFTRLASTRPHQVSDQSALYEEYLQDLLASADGLDLHGMTVVLDCANGAASRAAPDIFNRLGARVIAIHADPSAVINQQAGSEHVRSEPAALAGLIRQTQADLGIAFDGDADRTILMDENGRLIDGDHMLAILADFLHQQGLLRGNALVTTIMANGALSQYATSRGFKLIETPVGDKYVTEALLTLEAENPTRRGFGLGGEQSGHIILLDESHHTGDGLRTAIYMLRALSGQEKRSLAALAGSMQKYPQLVASCNVARKPDLEEINALKSQLARLHQDLPGLVRLNSRYSGTEPKYRLMLETDPRHSAAEVAAKAWQICRLIQQETGTPPDAKIEVLNVAEGGLMPEPDRPQDEESNE